MSGPTTHDVCEGLWGHKVDVLEVLGRGEDYGHELRVAGWLTPLPRVGDFVLLPHEECHDTRYRFETVEPCGDPPDMFFANLSFAPRSSNRAAIAKAEGR